MSLAVFGIFMPVYLDRIGYNGAQVGILTASGSIVALFSQPLWGVASDRAKTKNSVLSLLLLFSSLIILLFRLSEEFYFILLAMVMLAFFQNPTFPISDAITLEYMTPTGWKYGPVRLSGTIGYAVIAVFAGEVAKRNMNAIFIFSFAIGILTLLASLRLPKVAGHQAAGKRVSVFKLFKNRELMLLMIFTVSIHGTLSFYNAFFGIYYTQMGADNALLGWAIFLSAISEVFFLIWGDRVIRKIGIKPTLFGAGLIAVIRWLLFGFVENIYLVLALQVLHGFIFIVLSYSMAMYINREVPQ
ncbi:MAG: MFS transporter, partial [Clostridiaceae bacterium]|nr:MFS transporter [Clostridiaceae bacterium]